MGVHRPRRYPAGAATACLVLAACTSGGGDPAPADPPSAGTIQLVAAPKSVTLRLPAGCTRLPDGSVRIDLVGALALPVEDTRPVFYEVEVVAAERTFSGYVTAEPPRAHPGSTSLWVLPPTPLNREVPESLVAPEDWAGVRRVPYPLEQCNLSIVEAQPGEVEAGGRPVQVSDEGGPVVIDAEGRVEPA